MRQLSLRNRSRIRGIKDAVVRRERHHRERGGCLSRVNNRLRISPSSLLSCHRLAVPEAIQCDANIHSSKTMAPLTCPGADRPPLGDAREPQDVAAAADRRRPTDRLGAVHFGTYCLARTIVPSSLSTGQKGELFSLCASFTEENGVEKVRETIKKQ